MKTILGLIAFVFLAAVTFAAPSDLAGTDQSGIPGLSVKQALWVSIGAQVLKWLAELYSAVRNGGGLRRIIMAFWFGENLPKVVAADYKPELETRSPIPPKPPAA